MPAYLECNPLPMMEGLIVPEYFCTDVGKTEDAGGNCVRIYNCVRRDGILVPQLAIIMPALSVMVAVGLVTEAAVRVCEAAGLTRYLRTTFAN